MNPPANLSVVPDVIAPPITTIYGKPTGCFGCNKTKDKLDAAGVPYQWVDVTADTDEGRQSLAAIRELGYQQVPVIVTTRADGGDEHWSGLQPARIDDIITRHRASQTVAA